MKNLAYLLLLISFFYSVFTYAVEITDSAETLGYEVLAGYGVGTATGLSAYLIHKDGSKSWMPQTFAYAFPAGAAGGVLLAGEITGEKTTNRAITIVVTIVSAYIPLLIGELLDPKDGRALGALFSVPAATAAYNYIKKSPDDGSMAKTFSLSFSFDI